jgi:hypothetical protein
MKKPFKEIAGTLIFILILIGLGVMMIMNPDLGGYEPHGRHYLIKKIIAMVWGRPAGIISIIFGLFALVGTFMPEKAAPQDQEQGEEA